MSLHFWVIVVAKVASEGEIQDQTAREGSIPDIFSGFSPEIVMHHTGRRHKSSSKCIG